MGRGRPGQDQTPLETLLPEHTGMLHAGICSDLKVKLFQYNTLMNQSTMKVWR